MAFTLTEISMMVGLAVNIGVLVSVAVKMERRFTTLEVKVDRIETDRRHHARN